MKKPVAYIHNWLYLPDPYPHLHGRISDHPQQHRFRGKVHQTAEIVKMPMVLAPGSKVETLKTLYVLGFDYRHKIKKARQRKRENVTDSSK